MNKYSGYESKQIKSDFETLPVGGYVCKIMNAEEKVYSWGSKLEVSIDISEGTHKDFYANAYKNDDRPERKWRGVYRLNVPNESSEYFESQKKTFNNFAWCLEDANEGYHWDWDEKKLEGKKIGLVFRNEEWEMNGKSGWTVRPFKAICIGDVRDGKWGKFEDKPLPASKKTTYAAPVIDDSFEEGDLPF